MYTPQIDQYTMGSKLSTSTNDDTNYIYTGQQVIETMEDKYNELLKQNQLLKQENEIIKLGNYNLKRDNDHLRENVYNLRLKNKNLETDKDIILYELNQSKLPKTNVLPKVADKEICYDFIKYCITFHDEEFLTYEYWRQIEIKSNAEIENMMNDTTEYIVHLSVINDIALLVTNKGKTFVHRGYKSISYGYYSKPVLFETFYLDFKVDEMCEYILNYIIIMTTEEDFKKYKYKRKTEDQYHWKYLNDIGNIEDHPHLKMYSAWSRKSPNEFAKMFNLGRVNLKGRYSVFEKYLE